LNFGKNIKSMYWRKIAKIASSIKDATEIGYPHVED
jgi:hypothetical protein